MKPIRYTAHAVERMQEWRFQEAEIESVVRDPAITLPSRRQGRRDVIGYVQGRAIRVIYGESREALWIITTYPVGK